MKENQIRELVNELHDIAIEYHGTQQLRERIARTVRAAIIQAGNSPVIPEGYALVPIEATEEMLQASYRESSVYSPSAYRAMIAAAPQQEVTQALAKGMERYGDAMRELAKKEAKP
ncbi:hypothetical protein HX37_18380 [Salmonella enterica]|uniref:Phage protein n=1 Tax=Salmonella enterica TaxID=28901 RepID=A0A5U2F7U4_SALER|nr:hypothetical protein [Salmonella enterica]